MATGEAMSDGFAVRWLTAFIDVPESDHAATAEFWAAITATSLSDPRGDEGQYATFEPQAGDACLRLQRFDAGPRVHLDLHVTSIAEAAERAVALGASPIGDRGYRIMASPARFTFCLVTHDDESTPAPPLTEPAPHRFDTVCIDVPHEMFDGEIGFWQQLTGWERRQGSAYPEFAALLPETGRLPKLLLQQLGAQDPRTTAHAHLDFGCGNEVAAVTARHLELGASLVAEFGDWNVLADPAGMHYCLTDQPVGNERIPGGGWQDIQ